MFRAVKTSCYLATLQIFVAAVALGGCLRKGWTFNIYMPTHITSRYKSNFFFLTSNTKTVTMAVETEHHWTGRNCLMNTYITCTYLFTFWRKWFFTRKEFTISHLILWTKILISNLCQKIRALFTLVWRHPSNIS
jgi:hypothetical protein